jgi:hypothetical protein
VICCCSHQVIQKSGEKIVIRTPALLPELANVKYISVPHSINSEYFVTRKEIGGLCDSRRLNGSHPFFIKRKISNQRNQFDLIETNINAAIVATQRKLVNKAFGNDTSPKIKIFSDSCISIQKQIICDLQYIRHRKSISDRENKDMFYRTLEIFISVLSSKDFLHNELYSSYNLLHIVRDCLGDGLVKLE